MARGHIDLPVNVPPVVVTKRSIFDDLKSIDGDRSARERILKMETNFRRKIETHLLGLPTEKARFQAFNTSPFVLMFYSKQKSYKHVAEIERDIIPAKVFSSMETSAGRMVEEVVLPVYGWEVVPSAMHSSKSVLDGHGLQNNIHKFVTLKSGPRCLNDEMAKDIGRDVVANVNAWAAEYKLSAVEFTYGVLYGTKRLSNKKDWHILRNMAEALPSGAALTEGCRGRWGVGYKINGLKVEASVRVGIEWWSYLGGPTAWLELCIALIRACVAPGPDLSTPPSYTIADLSSILDISGLPSGYNVALLQKSQFEWLLFLARHFCDDLQD